MNKRLMALTRKSALCLISVLIFNMSSNAESIENIRVLKISGEDQKAVIKTNERELKIIKVNDLLPVAGVEMRVKEIAKERIVLEEQTDKGIETVIIRLENGKQRTERIRKVVDQPPPMYRPREIDPGEFEDQKAGQGRSGSMF